MIYIFMYVYIYIIHIHLGSEYGHESVTIRGMIPQVPDGLCCASAAPRSVPSARRGGSAEQHCEPGVEMLLGKFHHDLNDRAHHR